MHPLKIVDRDNKLSIVKFSYDQIFELCDLEISYMEQICTEQKFIIVPEQLYFFVKTTKIIMYIVFVDR